jgi:hypothetical protein
MEFEFFFNGVKVFHQAYLFGIVVSYVAQNLASSFRRKRDIFYLHIDFVEWFEKFPD